MARRAWIGRSLVAIGVLHSVRGVGDADAPLRRMVAEGLWDTVGADTVRQSAFWFLVAGVALLLAGVLVDALERARRPLPVPFTWGLLLLAVTGVVAMPGSGFWLVLVVAVGAIVRSPRRSLGGAASDRAPEARSHARA